MINQLEEEERLLQELIAKQIMTDGTYLLQDFLVYVMQIVLPKINRRVSEGLPGLVDRSLFLGVLNMTVVFFPNPIDPSLNVLFVL